MFILEYLKICFYFHWHQKGAHLWQKGAIQRGATEVWGAVAPNCPLAPPLFSCSLLFLLYRNIMTFDALLVNLRHASGNWWKLNKNLIKFGGGFYCYFKMYVIILRKLRFDQIGCSGRSGTR